MPVNCERRVQAAKQGIEPDSKGFDADLMPSVLFLHFLLAQHLWITTSNMLQLHVGHTHGRGTCTRWHGIGARKNTVRVADRSASFYDQCITEVVTHLKTTESQLNHNYTVSVFCYENRFPGKPVKSIKKFNHLQGF